MRWRHSGEARNSWRSGPAAVARIVSAAKDDESERAGATFRVWSPLPPYVTWRRTARAVAIMAMTVALGTTVSAAPAAGPGTGATVNIDGADPGPAFQGIGAISGGGGNSRLLIDYPPGERAQILDYLFSPHFGAALQMLKLEIGGGGFSSDGSEPSVEPAEGQLDCGAGYEFWLARQALARNPAIKLYGLQWSAPAWVRDPHGGLWSRADVGYVVDWLRCARRNGLAVSYVGGWNEHYLGTGDQQAWFVNLRTALDAAGFTRTRIVAADEAPQMAERPGRVRYSPLLVSQGVADDMVTDPSFGRVVSVLDVHDSCGLPTTGYRCIVAAPARTLAAHTGKQLWESELGATPATGTNPALPGPGGLARALDDAYDQAGITGILVWPLIDAIRRISRTKTGPGLGRPAYETYLAPGRSAWSMVAQTSVAGAAQRITVRVSGGLPARVVHVWSTSLRGAGQFIRPGHRDTRLGTRHRRPLLQAEPHHPRQHHLRADQWRPRGHRDQSHAPVRPGRAREPRILSRTLPRLHRPAPIDWPGPRPGC